MAKGALTNILFQELARLDGIQSQHPETGAGINSGNVYIDQYTNRIFGSPFQLIDSVDRRFSDVNKHVGNEYLRNFILNSPILHIKPGMPIYTGGATGSALVKSIKEIYVGTNTGLSFVEAMLTELAKNTIFNKGSRLQKRMFGFRENYYGYMSHVNYMCRSMATFLNLTSNDKSLNRFPTGIYANGSIKLQPFASMNWQNYRMLTTTKYTSPREQVGRIANATLLGAASKSIASGISNSVKFIGKSAGEAAAALSETLQGRGDNTDLLGGLSDVAKNTLGKAISDAAQAFSDAAQSSVVDVLVDKVSSVLFMVEPTQFEETLTNEVENSIIESTIDGITNSLGHELAFITNSNVDLGLIEGMTEFLGNTAATAANFVAGLVEPITGGFASNLFRGALGSIKGQKMIYPKIYKSSNSEMNYQFTVNLSTPYGDVYNYYTNLVVPLSHLVCLAGPRMLTANTVASPFLVQAFIPGMCTCNLGIISNMTITKNPSGKHVSVNGFPLDIKVTFTIQELYNSMSISPSNDPASFLFNETLNDYMANMAGLQPSTDTYTRQRKATFQAMQGYFEKQEFLDDIANNDLLRFEQAVNPFISR